MNCKPGDLAIVVRSTPRLRNEGVIVTVVRWCEPMTERHPQTNTINRHGGWFCEGRHRRQLHLATGEIKVVEVECGVFSDGDLRPLRDNDDVDETLRIDYLKDKEKVW